MNSLKTIFQIHYCKTTQTDDERISVGEFSMGSQGSLAFDDELSLDDGGIQIGSFDESPSRQVQKHLKNLDFHHYGSGNYQVFKLKNVNKNISRHTKKPLKNIYNLFLLSCRHSATRRSEKFSVVKNFPGSLHKHRVSLKGHSLKMYGNEINEKNTEMFLVRSHFHWLHQRFHKWCWREIWQKRVAHTEPEDFWREIDSQSRSSSHWLFHISSRACSGLLRCKQKQGCVNVTGECHKCMEYQL